MCKQDGKTINHLLLHCPDAIDLWDMVFCLFGVDWVMPREILDLLSCCLSCLGEFNGAIWSMILHRLLWQEKNDQTFERCEKSHRDLKLFFVCTFLVGQCYRTFILFFSIRFD